MSLTFIAHHPPLTPFLIQYWKCRPKSGKDLMSSIWIKKKLLVKFGWFFCFFFFFSFLPLDGKSLDINFKFSFHRYFGSISILIKRRKESGLTNLKQKCYFCNWRAHLRREGYWSTSLLIRANLVCGKHTRLRPNI